MKQELTVKVPNFVKLSICMSLFLLVAKGYPTTSTEMPIQPEEKLYPNGTVIGQYAYVDKDGSQVQVKYFADDSSYGVELNSFKTVQENQEEPKEEPIMSVPTQEKKLQRKKENDKTLSIIGKENMPDALVKSKLFDTIATFKYPEPKTSNKYETNANNLDSFHKKEAPVHQKRKYKGPDYEIYANNDLESQQCGPNNEKVKVYNFVKKARKALVDVEEDAAEGGGEFCDI